MEQELENADKMCFTAKIQYEIIVGLYRLMNMVTWVI